VTAVDTCGPSQFDDTIVAQATPVGRGALAVIRLTGDKAFDIARRHVRSWPSRSRVAQLSTILCGERVLDQAVVTLFPGPDSFTGEDTVEISSHGGSVVPDSLVAAFISSGARQALPGEFTRRAVLNGKLDILQAEAIGDLIDARSSGMQRAALDQLDGGLSRRLLALREEMVGLEALIAYDIDFPEEDDGPVPRARIKEAADHAIFSLEALLSTAPAGEIVREGAVVVIAGPPNAGKSSLFNALIGKARAIVTEIPGTTRDALEAFIDTGQYPLRLVDTAGLRDTLDPLERLGIEMSGRYLSTAHVVLACAETESGVESTTAAIRTYSGAELIGVRTKSDLVPNGYQTPTSTNRIFVSAETGSGLQDLVSAIEAVLASKYREIHPDRPILTNARHKQALTQALREMKKFEELWRGENLPAPVASVHLRSAVYALEELIGTVDLDDVLDRLFSGFCVGK
jgi:tRNA modification GTPase